MDEQRDRSGDADVADHAVATPAVERAEPVEPGRRKRPLPGLALPDVPLWVAATATGIMAGLGTVLLVGLGLLGCDAVRGAPSCGGSGYPLLLLIMVLVGIGAAALLRLVGADSPGTVSFLGVCLMLIVALAFLVESAFSSWMWAVMPLVGAGAFVTSAYLVRAGESTDGAGR